MRGAFRIAREMNTRCLMKSRVIAIWMSAAACFALAMPAMAACSVGARMTLVNPTDGTLYVQVNEATPIAIPAKASATVKTSPVENFGLVTITARDRLGVLICFLATSTGSVRRTNGAVTLTPNQATFDPHGYPGVVP